MLGRVLLLTITMNPVCVFLIAGLIMLGASAETTPKQPHQLVKIRYVSALARFDSAVGVFRQAVQTNRPATDVQRAFRQMRLAYKPVECLTEFYFPGSAKRLNGPPVPDADFDDGRWIAWPPYGLQVIEALVFPLDPARKIILNAELKRLQETTNSLRNVVNYTQLSDAHVFGAMRLEVFRIITLGITGFDSPIDNNSLPEAAVSLETMQQMVTHYPLAARNQALATQLNRAFSLAISRLRGQKFMPFDRLTFIRDCAYPLSRLLAETQKTLGLTLPTDKRLLKQSARTLSDVGAFEPMAFARYDTRAPTPDRVALGKMLFSNPVLSSDGKRTCQTCHQPERGFTDGEKTAFSIDGKTRISRNTPTLLNAGLQSFQFIDSRVFFLEDQITDVVHNPDEMGGSTQRAVEILKKDADYQAHFRKAYPDSLTEVNLRNALASYVRSLTPADSRVDRYLRADEPKAMLTTDEKLGFNVFMGKGRCGTCHYFPIFNGTVPPAYIKSESEIIGTPATAAGKKLSPDIGRAGFTGLEIHQNAFKTPTLRGIGKTAPYMHNGVYKTLEQVVDFYDKGGGKGLGFGPENQTLPFDKLNLTAPEKRALVAFMKAL